MVSRTTAGRPLPDLTGGRGPTRDASAGRLRTTLSRVSQRQWIIWGAAAAVGLVYLAVARYFWSYTVDDAYISARYAYNAALGRGLVFNPGDRVMGYTNLLLVIIEAGVYRLGGDAVMWAKLLGLAGGMATLALTAHLGGLVRPQARRTAGLLAAALLVVYPYLAMSSVMGLETSLFAALVLGSVELFLGAMAASWTPRRQAGLALLLALATLTRPEGAAFAALLGMAQAVRAWRGRYRNRAAHTSSPAADMLWLAFYILLLLPVVIALVVYYGSPIPNTFFAKTAAGLAWNKYRDGAAYLVSWVRSTGCYLLVPLSCWPFLARRQNLAARLAGGLVLFYSAYVIYSGGDWMVGYRFLMPVLPFCLALAAAALTDLWGQMAGRVAALSWKGRVLLAAGLAAAIIGPSLAGSATWRGWTMDSRDGYVKAHLYVGEWLRDHTPANATVALMDVGIIGMVSNRHIIDTAGLVNRDVALLNHEGGDSGQSSVVAALAAAVTGRTQTPTPSPVAGEVAQEVLAERPDYIVLAHNNPDGQPFVSQWSHDAAIYQSPEFKAHYRYLYTRRYVQDYYLTVYQRMATVTPQS
jgi:arabinofuranosyltransferase